MIQKIVNSNEESEKQSLAKQIYDLGLLSHNMLTGADLTAFINRSVEMIGKN